MGGFLGTVVIIIGVMFILYFVIPKEKTDAQPKKQITTIQKETAPFVSFFWTDLFSRLSYLKVHGIHNHIDYILFAMFKARLCAVSYVSQADISEQKRQEIMDAFDVDMYLFFGLWMDSNAPDFTQKVNITDSRMLNYEKVFMSFSSHSNRPIPFVMSFVTSTLYWFLSDGWKKNFDGKFSTVPRNDFDFEYLKIPAEISERYNVIFDELDPIILNFCDLNISNYIKQLKNTLS